MIFHRHNWQKYDVEYNEPLPAEQRYYQQASDAYQKQAFGFTNITWKCSKCPQVKIEQHIGRVSL